jgi:hypothetical protein
LAEAIGERTNEVNLRNVLRAFTLLRQLTDDETALLSTLRSLSENERELLVESLSPQKPATKRKAGKSARAKSLQTVVSTARPNKPEIPCAYVDDSGNHCMEVESNPIHDATMGYRNHHEFQPPKSTATAAAKDDHYEGQAAAGVSVATGFSGNK